MKYSKYLKSHKKCQMIYLTEKSAVSAYVLSYLAYHV